MNAQWCYDITIQAAKLYTEHMYGGPCIHKSKIIKLLDLSIKSHVVNNLRQCYIKHVQITLESKASRQGQCCFQQSCEPEFGLVWKVVYI